MNRRIQKKRQKLFGMNASKYKDLKRIKKRAHATHVEVRHGSWGMFPDKDNYAKYLRRKRRGDKIESTIEKHFLFSEMCRWQQMNALRKKRRKAKNVES